MVVRCIQVDMHEKISRAQLPDKLFSPSLAANWEGGIFKEGCIWVWVEHEPIPGFQAVHQLGLNVLTIINCVFAPQCIFQLNWNQIGRVFLWKKTTQFETFKSLSQTREKTKDILCNKPMSNRDVPRYFVTSMIFFETVEYTQTAGRREETKMSIVYKPSLLDQQECACS
jgi:hypothetical protein